MKYITIGEICTVTKGNISITKAIDGKYPLVATKEKRGSHNEYQFDEPSVIIPLVSATGHGHASIKRIHYQEGKYAVGNILAVCIPKDTKKYSAKFLYLYLSLMKDYILVPLMKGSANVSLTIKNLKTAKIPDISFLEQENIISLYNQANPKIEKVLTSIYEQQNLISNLRQSILHEAVRGKLTEDWRKENSNVEHAFQLLKRIKNEKEVLIKEKKIKNEKSLSSITKDEIPYELPENWEWCRLYDSCLYIQRGKSPKYSTESAVPVISQKCVQWSGFDISKARYIEMETISKYDEIRFLKDGDLLWNSTGDGTVGRVALYESKSSFPKVVADSHVTVVRASHLGLLPEYLYYFTASPTIQNIISSSVSGSTKQTELGTTTIKNFLFALPPIDEQKEIVFKVKNLMSSCDLLEKQVRKSKSQTELLMQSVLQEVFSPNRERVIDLFDNKYTYQELANLQQAMIFLKTETELGAGRGKVYAQKTSALLKGIYHANISYKFEKSHYGEFSYQLSEDIDKNPYLRKRKIETGETVYEVKSSKSKEVIDALNSSSNLAFVESIDNLLHIYKKQPINGITDYVELLNTVCRAIKDTKSTIGNVVYEYLEDWDIKQGQYRTKADKFTKSQTFAIIALVQSIGWDKKLIK